MRFIFRKLSFIHYTCTPSLNEIYFQKVIISFIREVAAVCLQKVMHNDWYRDMLITTQSNKATKIDTNSRIRATFIIFLPVENSTNS